MGVDSAQRKEAFHLDLGSPFVGTNIWDSMGGDSGIYFVGFSASRVPLLRFVGMNVGCLSLTLPLCVHSLKLYKPLLLSL